MRPVASSGGSEKHHGTDKHRDRHVANQPPVFERRPVVVRHHQHGGQHPDDDRSQHRRLGHEHGQIGGSQDQGQQRDEPQPSREPGRNRPRHATAWKRTMRVNDLVHLNVPQVVHRVACPHEGDDAQGKQHRCREALRGPIVPEDHGGTQRHRGRPEHEVGRPGQFEQRSGSTCHEAKPSQRDMDLCPSRGRDGPDADADAEPAVGAAVVEADLLETTVTGENVADLVHRRTPAEAAVDVVKDHRGVGLTGFTKVGVDGLTKALGAPHQATPRTCKALALAWRP